MTRDYTQYWRKSRLFRLNVSELKSYLGLLTYYNRFLPNLSTLLAPLYEFLDQSWNWTAAQDKAFRESKALMVKALMVKALMVKSQLLVHLDPGLEIVLACDPIMELEPYSHSACQMARKDRWVLSRGEQRESIPRLRRRD